MFSATSEAPPGGDGAINGGCSLRSAPPAAAFSWASRVFASFSLYSTSRPRRTAKAAPLSRQGFLEVLLPETLSPVAVPLAAASANL